MEKTPHRVLRIIEYVGEKEWLEASLAARKIKGRVDFGDDRGYIQEAVLGNTAEILEYSALDAEAARILRRTICPTCLGGKALDPRTCLSCGGSGWFDSSGPYEETAAELAAVSGRVVRAERERERSEK